MTVPDRLVTVPPVSRDDLVIVGPGLEQAIGRWVTTVPLEMDDTSTAVVTVELLEQDEGEIMEVLGPVFLRRDPRTGHRKLEKTLAMRLHDTSYMLRVMRRTSDGMALDFYDEASEDLKRYFGPIKWSRGKFTRAQGIRGLANEAGVQSYIPDRDTKQPIADLSKEGRRTLNASQAAAAVGGFNRVYPSHGTGQPGTALLPRQVRAIAESAGLPGLAFEQIAHGESSYRPGVYQTGFAGQDQGFGLWQLTPHAWDASLPAWPTREQLLASTADVARFMGRLGGVEQMFNPVKNAQVAKELFDASGIGAWAGTTFLTDDAKREAEARRTHTVDSGGIADRAYVERFEFAVAARESYWDAAERFASEVHWRRFTAFNHLVYASDFTLADLSPYALSLAEDWIDDPGDWVISTDQAIDELPLKGRLEAIVPPGTAFVVTDDGDPRYGTWLARNFKRDLLDEECNVELNLTRPEAPLPEPASTVRTLSSGGAGASLKSKDGVAAPLERVLSSSNGYSASHDGVDLICKGQAPIYAICDATVIDVRAGGWWGKNPTGDVSIGDGIIQLECLVDAGPFRKGMHFGYGHAEHATVRVGEQVRAGQRIGRAGFANAWHVHFMVNGGGTTSGIGDRDPMPFVDYATSKANAL